MRNFIFTLTIILISSSLHADVTSGCHEVAFCNGNEVNKEIFMAKMNELSNLKQQLIDSIDIKKGTDEYDYPYVYAQTMLRYKENIKNFEKDLIKVVSASTDNKYKDIKLYANKQLQRGLNSLSSGLNNSCRTSSCEEKLKQDRENESDLLQALANQTSKDNQIIDVQIGDLIKHAIAEVLFDSMKEILNESKGSNDECIEISDLFNAQQSLVNTYLSADVEVSNIIQSFQSSIINKTAELVEEKYSFLRSKNIVGEKRIVKNQGNIKNASNLTYLNELSNEEFVKLISSRRYDDEETRKWILGNKKDLSHLYGLELMMGGESRQVETWKDLNKNQFSEVIKKNLDEATTDEIKEFGHKAIYEFSGIANIKSYGLKNIKLYGVDNLSHVNGNTQRLELHRVEDIRKYGIELLEEASGNVQRLKKYSSNEQDFKALQYIGLLNVEKYSLPIARLIYKSYTITYDNRKTKLFNELDKYIAIYGKRYVALEGISDIRYNFEKHLKKLAGNEGFFYTKKGSNVYTNTPDHTFLEDEYYNVAPSEMLSNTSNYEDNEPERIPLSLLKEDFEKNYRQEFLSTLFHKGGRLVGTELAYEGQIAIWYGRIGGLLAPYYGTSVEDVKNAVLQGCEKNKKKGYKFNESCEDIFNETQVKVKNFN